MQNELQLDLSIEFVRLVFDIIENDAPLSPAVDLLGSYELENGASIWCELHKDSQFGGLFVPIEKETQLTLRQLTDSFPDWGSVWPKYYQLPEIGDPLVHLEEHALKPLIASTQLLLSGADFNDLYVLFEDGTIAGWSMRAWGRVMAECANGNRWGTNSPFGWTYLDFYLNTPIERYEEWGNTVRKVIKQKTELEMASV